MLRTRLLAFLALMSLGALGLASCGGDEEESGATDTSPATFAPAAAPMYFEGTVRFDGRGADSLESIAARFPGGEDLEATIAAAINEAFAGDPETEGLTYEDDIEPWLGDRAAIAVTDASAFTPELAEIDVTGIGESGSVDLPESDAEPFLVMAQTTDPEAARATLETGGEFTDAEYEGVEMIVSDHTTVAFPDDYLVAAPDREAVEAAIDRSAGNEPSLADSEGWSYEVGDVDAADALAFGRLDFGAVIDSAISADGDLDREQFEEILGGSGYDFDQPATLALVVEEDAVRFYSQMGGAGEGELLGEGVTELIGGLPSNANVAFGCPGCIGGLLSGFAIGFEQSAAEDNVDAERAAELFEQTFGVSIDELPEIVGDVAFFAAPGGLVGVEGGAVFGVEDRDAMVDLLESLTRVLQREVPGVRISAQNEGDLTTFEISGPGLPPLGAVLGSDRFAIGLGVSPETLAPDETLSDSGRLDEISGSLASDLEPFAFADLGALIDSVGLLAASDPDFAHVQSYLEPLGLIVIGAGEDGGELASETAITFDD